MLEALGLVAFLALVAALIYALARLPVWFVNRVVGRPSDAFEAEDRARQSRKNS